MPQNDLQSYLQAVPTTDNVRADAWEAFNHSADKADFEKRIGALDLPQQVKADLWEAKFSGKSLSAPAAVPVSAPAPTPEPPQALTPPHEQGLLSRVMGWANEPMNIGHLRESVKQAEDYSNAPPTLDEAINHPYITPVKKAVEGFGADAAKMLLTPTSAAMTALGLISGGASSAVQAAAEAGEAAPIASKLSVATKAALASTGIGFGAQGVTDLGKMALSALGIGAPQAPEKPEDFIRRIGSDAAMLVGGAAGLVEAPHVVKQIRGGVADATEIPPSASRPMGSESRNGIEGPESTPAPTKESVATLAAQNRQPTPQDQSTANDALLRAAQERKAQAIGSTKARPTKTIYVDPEFAKELQNWNQNTDLAGKRVILRKNGTVDLAHLDPDTERFVTSEVTSNNAFSETGAEGQVPVQLSQTNGQRGTSVPGHYLSATLPDEVEGAPVEEAQAAATEQALPPSTRNPYLGIDEPHKISVQMKDGTPFTLERMFAGKYKAVDAGGNRIGTFSYIRYPDGDWKMSGAEVEPAFKRRGIATAAYDALEKVVGGKFQDIGSQTEQGRAFWDSRRQQAESSKVPEGGVEPGVVETPKTVEPPASTVPEVPQEESTTSTNPSTFEVSREEKFAKSDDQSGNVSEQKPIEGPAPTDMSTAQVVEKHTPVDVSALEDRIRPLVGQVLRLSQLKLGEAASHAIDTAIEHSRESGGEIPSDVADKVSRLLNEPVGRVLTPEQELKLEKLRGGTPSREAKVRFLSPSEVRNRLSAEDRKSGDPSTWTGEPFKQLLEQSQEAMIAALSDPDTPPETLEKIHRALGLADGKEHPALYAPTLTYPRATELPSEHPEAPFTTHAFGHSITPIILENLSVALGKPVRTKFLETASSDPYVTPEERARLRELSQSNKNLGVIRPDDNPAALLKEVIGEDKATRGREFKADDSREYRRYARQIQQNALARRLDKAVQELRGLSATWNDQRKGAITPLVEQLSRLSDEAKSHLPESLFNGESSETETSKTPESKQSSKTSSSSKKTAASAFKSRQITDVAGIVTTKYEGLIHRNFPHAVAAIDRIRYNVQENFGVAARQKAYNNAMKELYAALEKDDEYAVKKGIDASLYTGPKEMNAGLGLAPKGASFREPYSPEDLHIINSSTADAILSRYEKMSPSELLKKKEGLWKDSLVNRIEGAAPTSEDPGIRAEQAETYAELVERHNELKRQVGPAKNLVDRLTDIALARTQRASAKRIMREVRGKQFRNNAILHAMFQQLANLLDALPVPEQDRFFDNMSRGRDQVPDVFNTIDPEFLRKWEAQNGPVPDPNEIAEAIRAASDEARDRVTAASGDLREFLLDYMPGMYENQAKARRFAEGWTSRRPLKGNSDFLKQKVYEFHEDALRAGLQPITSNPVRAMLMRVEQLNRYAMAHEFKNRLIDEGLAEFYADGETPPEGHVQLNDRIFGQGGLGGYYAPDSVARMFNNFVSTGLAGKWRVPYLDFSLYDAIRNSNSLANSFQLGISAFHAMETIANSGFSTMAVGLRQAINEGKVVKGLGNIAKGLTFVAPVAEDLWNGTKGLGNFQDPTKNVDYFELGNDLERVNAQPHVLSQFELDSINRMKEAWATATDNFMPMGKRMVAGLRVVTNLTSAGIEAAAWPLMKWFIPRMKIGAFYKMAQQIHEEMVGEHPDAITEELQKAWDSVDNRFGEMTRENLFMNKTAQDILNLTVRSPGWNIGTLREVGGGVLDLGKSAVDAAQGKPFKISNRTAYVASLVSGTMFLNALYQYMHPKAPKPEGIDYLFPQDGTKSVTGEANRVYPKTYVYDFINLYHDPVNTVWHKAAPGISTLSDIIRNEDYYHRTIRDPGDSLLRQAASSLAYIAHQFVPFSFSNLAESKLRNQKSNWESFVGVLPAPRWVGRTRAENLAFEYKNAEDPQGALDNSDLERRAKFVELRNKVADGQITEEQLAQAVLDGKIPAKSVQYLFKTLNKPQLQLWTEGLRSPKHIMNVWEAASPEEKKILFPVVITKITSQTAGEEQQQFLNKLQAYADQHPDL